MYRPRQVRYHWSYDGLDGIVRRNLAVEVNDMYLQTPQVVLDIVKHGPVHGRRGEDERHEDDDLGVPLTLEPPLGCVVDETLTCPSPEYKNMFSYFTHLRMPEPDPLVRVPVQPLITVIP